MRGSDDWDVNDFGKDDGLTKPQAQAAVVAWWSKPAVKIALGVLAVIAVLWVLF